MPERTYQKQPQHKATATDAGRLAVPAQLAPAASRLEATATLLGPGYAGPSAAPVATGAPVQRRASPGAVGSMFLTKHSSGARTGEPPTGAPVHEAATLGTSGPSGPLPYLARIQRSFGKHDVSGLAAHTGGAAEAGARAMGAEAFTRGRHVAFAGTPSLHTAAHEAAHAVQQQAGVDVPGGVGQEGDRYERHADEVAARVVAGQSSEDLLSGYDRRTGAGGCAVQRQLVDQNGMSTWARIHHAFTKKKKGTRTKLAKKANIVQDKQDLRALYTNHTDAEKLEALTTRIVANDYEDFVTKLGKGKFTTQLAVYNAMGIAGNPVSEARKRRDRAAKAPKLPSVEEFKSNDEDSKSVFDNAEVLRGKQDRLAKWTLKKAKLDKIGRVTTLLKRKDHAAFKKGVETKIGGKGYGSLDQMDDMVRGRIDLATPEQVDRVFELITQAPGFNVKSHEEPRREQTDERGHAGYGYPRYHVILADSVTGLTHEWQIGTYATSRMAEDRGIKVPALLQEKLPNLGKVDNAKAGPRADLHDIEYAIFRNGVCKDTGKDAEALVTELQIKEYMGRVDKLSAQAGRKNDYDEKELVAVHERAGEILEVLVARLGVERVAGYAHG